MGNRKTAPGVRERGPAIGRSTTISEIFFLLPEAAKLLSDYGLHCAGCAFSSADTLEEGCRRHGFAEEDIEELAAELMAMLRGKRIRVKELTITKNAAQALKKIAHDEQEEGKWIIVKGDATGHFCLEFSAAAPKDAFAFSHPEVPDVRMTATLLTLEHIGGASIDFRDGAFKLDLPDAQKTCCKGTKHPCHCKTPAP